MTSFIRVRGKDNKSAHIHVFVICSISSFEIDRLNDL